MAQTSPKRAKTDSDAPSGVLGDIAGIGEFDFDIITLAKYAEAPLLPQLLSNVLSYNGVLDALISQGCVPKARAAKFRDRLCRFLGVVENTYDDVPYHGSQHAADVMMTVEWLMSSQWLRTQLSPLDHFSILIASAVHDVGHPGRNNGFLVKVSAPVAKQYGNQSVLENMHVAKTFSLLSESLNCDWLGLMSLDAQKLVKHRIEYLVLATDMAKHADHVAFLKGFVEQEDSEQRKVSSGNKDEILACILHAADISNPCKPRDMMLSWTKRILEEFWLQGDEERSLGHKPSFLCDRVSAARTVPEDQLGFIHNVVQPFYVLLESIIPEVKVATGIMLENIAFWEEKARRQSRFDDFNQIFGAVEDSNTKHVSANIMSPVGGS